MTNFKLLSNKGLTRVNFIIVGYFVMVYALNYYRVDAVLIGVFRELLTIPFLVAEVVFLILGINFLVKNKLRISTVFSLVLLIICSGFTLGSFIW